MANLEGWFTTIVAGVCLDMLRSRKSRREEPLDPDDATVGGPEQEAMLADSVGLALLVVLDTLPPAERVAFVLHDTFGLPFGEIASITGRSLLAAARRAGQPGPSPDPGNRPGQPTRPRARAWPGSGRVTDGVHGRLPRRRPRETDRRAGPRRGAALGRGGVAVRRPVDGPRRGRGGRHGARAASARARYGRIALVNGAPGLIMAPRGRLMVALAFTFSGDKISQIDVIADPDRLATLDLALLD